MRVPILKQGQFLIASLPSQLPDEDLASFRKELPDQIDKSRAAGVILDVAAVEEMDPFATRTLRDLAKVVRLHGARTVIVGIQPDAALAIVQLGLDLEGVDTALDLEEGLAFMRNGK